ncbi:MAG: amidohydrolase family protein [Acidimicrobiales bacterium]
MIPPPGEAVTRLVADHLVTVAAGGDGGHGGSGGDGGAAGSPPGIRVVAGGAVDIDAIGRIVAVGPPAQLGSGPAPTIVGGLLMPGLVNAHAHTPMTLVRSVGDGLPLQRWLAEEVWPREGRLTADDVRAGMALGSVEMLLAGVTTSCEMYFNEEVMVEAVLATGARMVNTPGVISALLPHGDVEPRIERIAAFHRSYDDPDGRIRVGFAPHSIYDLTPQQCGEIAARAQAVDALFHIHLDETRAERELTIATYGRSATRLLAEHGALEGRVLAAHGVWLDDDDRRLLAEAGASVAHCPQSNLKLGSGMADVAALLAAGVGVGVGTDGPASNDDLDLWEELRLTPLLARGLHHDPGALAVDRAFLLATSDAARAVGLDDVGWLGPGAWADLVRLDLDVPAFTPLRPDDLVTQLVFSGGARYVTDVWVAGRPVVVHREIVTVDVEALMADCQVRAARLTLDA